MSRRRAPRSALPFGLRRASAFFVFFLGVWGAHAAPKGRAASSGGATVTDAPPPSKGKPVVPDVSLEDESDDEDEEGPAAKKKPPKEENENEKANDQDAGAPKCTGDLDCDGRYVCRRGQCVPPEAPQQEAAESSPGVWLALGLMQDILFVSGSNACSQTSQVSGGFTCTRSSGSQYHGTPTANGGGSVGGIAISATRVTLGSYFRLANKISAGVRLGAAFLGGGPTPDGGHSYLWFSAEAEGAFWFSKRAFSTKAVGTFVEVSGGIAQDDGKSKVTVTENTMVPPPVSQLDNPPSQSLDAYRKSGAGFAGGGIGMFLPFGGATGLLADLRVFQLFPSSGTAISLGVSGALGL